jgi:hypothetical protein
MRQGGPQSRSEVCGEEENIPEIRNFKCSGRRISAH